MVKRPTPNTLKTLYIEEKLSPKTIGGMFGATAPTVVKWLKNDGVPIRNRSEAKAISGSGRKSSDPGRAVLSALYVEEQCSTAEIGERYGVTRETVWSWLAQHGLARTRSEARLVARKPAFTEEQRDEMRERALYARSRVTEDSHRKQSEAMRGRPAPNKGVPWTAEQRVKLEAIRATPEFKEKLAASLRGEKNVNWKGGVRQRRPSGWQWRQVRDAVYARDNWTCRDCGEKCKARSDPASYQRRRIQCHHVIPRRLGGADTLDNLVTLCASCHNKREREYDGALIY